MVKRHDVTVFECWYVLLAKEFRARAAGELADTSGPFRLVPLSAPTAAPFSMGSWWSPADHDSNSTLWVIWRKR